MSAVLGQAPFFLLCLLPLPGVLLNEAISLAPFTANVAANFVRSSEAV